MTAAPATARAGETDGGVYDIDWTVDLATLGAATLVWAVPQPLTGDIVSPRCPPCDRVNVPAIDRFALGRRSAVAKNVSDMGVAAVLTLPLLLDAIDVRGAGGSWAGLGKDVVVLAEAVVVNGALNELVKLAVRRPRPLTYGAPAGSPVLTEPENYLSFYSSHTSTAFAAGMAYATTFSLRHPDSRARYLVYGGAIAAGGGIGVTRMLAGKHFPSDVLVGALAGTAIGIGVPLMHRRDRRGRNSLTLYPAGAGLALVGTF